MSGETYDRQYYETACGPIPYDRAHPHWLAFFGAIADRIVADIGPRTVLDVGCAKGFLVESLRDRGVEAFGIDVSDYAIGEVRPDIGPFCRVASATQPLPRRYDLVVCIEVLEHLPAPEGRLAIANMCRASADVLFSSTPDDVDEPTHVNVRPRSYWIARFAEHAFALDLALDAGFVAPHAMRFRAGAADEPIVDALLAERDRRGAELADQRHATAAASAETAALREALATEARAAAALRGERDRLAAETAALRDQRSEALRARREATSALAALRAGAREAEGRMYHLAAYIELVHGTIGWRVLERVRRWRDRLVPGQSRRGRVYARGRDRVAELLGDGGARDALGTGAAGRVAGWPAVSGPAPTGPPTIDPATAAIDVMALDPPALDPAAAYEAWLERNTLTPAAVAAMRRRVDRLAYRPRISIVTPVYDTPEAWLTRMVASVRAQIYPEWELCLVDDGSTDPGVAPALEALAAADPRIRVRRLPKNEGIAAASAQVLQAATGEFVALLDHDDELAPDALFEVVARLAEDPALDLLYSDEDKLDADGRRVEPFFKPDWSPDLLLSMNYIAHLTVLRRQLVEAAGGFRRGFDGSQDYDLLLRVTERTSRIAHIPKVLYHWRKAAGSTSTGHAAKPLAHAAAERALADALARRGREGRIESASPGRYTVRYALTARPLVSIVIPTRDRLELLRECIDSVEAHTDYAPYEILVLDNESAEPETHAYLAALARRWRVIPCPGPFNFARINNLGVAAARGELLLFLNNDTQVRRADWLTAMVEQALRPEVGAVGARLLYPDGRIQHAGVVLGVGGVAGHAFKHSAGEAPAYFDLPSVIRNVSAVTAACMMVPRRVFEAVGGFDERLAVAFNDVDLCCRIRARGSMIVYTPLAELWHVESASRQRLHPPEDEALMRARWGETIEAGDPYYSPHLTLTREDWSIAP